MAGVDAFTLGRHVHRTPAFGTIAELVTEVDAVFEAWETLGLELEHIDLVANWFRGDSKLSRLGVAASTEVVVARCYPVIDGTEIAPDLVEHVVRAVRSCPKQALHLVERTC